MDSILRAFYNGHVRSDEQIVVHDPDYRAMSRKLGDMRERFLASLGEDARERFETFEQLSNRVQLRYVEEVFCQSFAMGARFAAETFLRDDAWADE